MDSAASARAALIYATATTALGAVFAFWFSGGLLKNFSTGLFTAGTPFTHTFFVAVLIGAFRWIILATITGLPVSTTHAIMGSLIGAGLVAFGHSTVQWHALGKAFLLPLAVSPFLSLLAVHVLAWPVVWAVIANKTSGRLPRGTGSLVGRFFTLLGSPNDTPTSSSRRAADWRWKRSTCAATTAPSAGRSGTGKQMNGVRLIQLHPAAAAKAGIHEGDTILVESPRGAVNGTAVLWEGIREDTILSPTPSAPCSWSPTIWARRDMRRRTC